MSKRVKNTTAPKGSGNYKTPRYKPSRNAENNRALNRGITAATAFYIIRNY